jgi:hypothetical protein
LRRRILEWALWLSITACLCVISLEAASFLVPRSQSFLAVGSTGAGSRIYALLRPGGIDMGSELDGHSDHPAPEIVNPRQIIAPRWSCGLVRSARERSSRPGTARKM